MSGKSLDASGRKPILCLDFDGTCTTFERGWEGVNVALDPPVDGLFEFLELMILYFDVCIYSARSGLEGGKLTMRNWFVKYFDAWLAVEASLGRKHVDYSTAIRFPTYKPPAFVSLDDRTITFTGTFPKLSELLEFEPWTGNSDIIVGEDYDKHG